MQSGTTGIIMVIILFALMYFLMIRPQKKRQRKHADTLKQLKKGDHVVTIGRLHGIVDEIDRQSETVTLDCDGIYLMFDMQAVASVNHSGGSSKSKSTDKTNHKATKKVSSSKSADKGKKESKSNK